jgi:hypothetical protein
VPFVESCWQAEPTGRTTTNGVAEPRAPVNAVKFAAVPPTAANVAAPAGVDADVELEETPRAIMLMPAMTRSSAATRISLLRRRSTYTAIRSP